MDAWYTPRARTEVADCYTADFIGRVLKSFRNLKRAERREIYDDLKDGSVKVGERLREASLIKASTLKSASIKKAAEIIEKAFEAEKLLEEWEENYADLFKDPLR